jgi:hypothetical protein
VIRGPSIPRPAEWPMPTRGLHEIDIPHPAIEDHPNFLGRIPSETLVRGARHYNPSIARHQGRVLMAYRVESYRTVSSVALCELDAEFRVTRTKVVNLPPEPGDVHWEDPHLCEAGGKLHLMALYIRLIVPPVCHPRVFEVDPDTFSVIREVPLSFGRLGGIEKNWAPFGLADGKLGFVYSQKPRLVVEIDTKAGHESPGVPIAPQGSSLSGRSCPVRIGNGYLEFVGGWVRHADQGARYWFGAQLVRGVPPYDVLRYTPEPLCWGSEASPTIHNRRTRAGHPACVFPAGAIIEGSSAIVSLGVNDSYCCLMRFSVPELLERMVDA